MTDGGLNPDDCEVALPQDLAAVMLEVILSFARLDSALSALLIQEYGLPTTRGYMLIANLDIGSKINRLINIYEHEGQLTAAKNFKKLKKDYEKKREPRNTIAHATYYGHLKSDPTIAVFLPARASSVRDNFLILGIPADLMLESAVWAGEMAKQIFNQYEKLATPPGSPPA